MKRFLLWKMRFSATSIVPYLLYMTGYAWKLERVSPLSSFQGFSTVWGLPYGGPLFFLWPFVRPKDPKRRFPLPTHFRKLHPSPPFFQSPASRFGVLRNAPRHKTRARAFSLSGYAAALKIRQTSRNVEFFGRNVISSQFLVICVISPNIGHTPFFSHSRIRRQAL